MKQRPLGVKIFGVSLILFNGYLLYWIPFLISITLNPVGGGAAPLFFGFVAVGMVLLGPAVGTGVLLLQNWARLLTLVLSVLWILLSLLQGPLLSLGQTLRVASWPVWNGVMLWYFLRPAVKAQFQRRE